MAAGGDAGTLQVQRWPAATHCCVQMHASDASLIADQSLNQASCAYQHQMASRRARRRGLGLGRPWAACPRGEGQCGGRQGRARRGRAGLKCMRGGPHSLWESAAPRALNAGMHGRVGWGRRAPKTMPQSDGRDGCCTARQAPPCMPTALPSGQPQPGRGKNEDQKNVQFCGGRGCLNWHVHAWGQPCVRVMRAGSGRALASWHLLAASPNLPGVPPGKPAAAHTC